MSTETERDWIEEVGGHGAGFWDRGYRHGIGDILTKAAHLCGESRLYYDPEDGKVHLT